MTLSQSSSDMRSRNSSLVIPAQDTTTDGGRENQAYGRGRLHTKTQVEPGQWRQCRLFKEGEVLSRSPVLVPAGT